MGFSTNQSQLKTDKMAIFYGLLIIKSKMASLPAKKPKNHQKTTIMSNFVPFGIKQKFIFFTNTLNIKFGT